MKASIHAAALAVLMLVALPMASAEVSTDTTYTFSEPGELAIETVSEASGEEARQFRMMHDANGDGEISQEEADQGEEHFLQLLEQEDGRGHTLDGELPRTWRVDDVAYEGMVGPADSSEPLTVRFTGQATYDVDEAADTREFRRTVAEEEAGATYTVHAPPGHRVASASGLEDAQEGEASVSGTGTGQEDVRVTFEPAPDEATNDTPGLPLVAVLLVGLGMALARHRRE